MKDNLEVNNTNLTNLKNNLWQVIGYTSYTENVKLRHNSSKYVHYLRQNDVIKIGRIKFLVKHLNMTGKKIQESRNIFSAKEVASRPENNADNCRICFDDVTSVENPLVSICSCKGSNSVHLNCLKQWVETKLKVNEINGMMGISYSTNSYNCEICKEPYPSRLLTSIVHSFGKHLQHNKLQRARRRKLRYSAVTQ